MAERDRFPVVVHVMLVRSEQVFLLRRANTGFMDGYHVMPGGHLHHGESVLQGAARECREEAGVDARLEPRCVLPYISGRHQGFNFVFASHDFEGEPRIAEPGLFDACGWYGRQSLPEQTAPWISEVLALPAHEWLRELSY